MDGKTRIPGYGECLCRKRQMIIVGAGRIGQNAVRFFEENSIKYFADNSADKIGKLWAGIPVIAVDELPEKKEKYDIVIASIEFAEELYAQLKQLGITEVYQFTSAEAFVVEETLAPYLGKKIAVYGTGKWAEDTIEYIGRERIAYVISDKGSAEYHTNWNGYLIRSVEEICDDVDCIFVTEVYPQNYIASAALRGISNRRYTVLDRQEFNYGSRALMVNNYGAEGFQAKAEEEFNQRVLENKKMFSVLSEFVCLSESMEKIPLFCNVQIETMNRCNGVCSFCPANRINDKREFHRMNDELFEKIIMELEQLNFDGKLFLYANNEPFLDDRIEKFAKYAREHLPKARIMLSTNGIVLTLERYLAVIPYVDDFRINNYNDELKLIPSAKEVQDYCKQHPELVKKTNIIMRKANEILTTRGGDAPNRSKKISHGTETCGEPYRTMIIRPTGKVSLCCNDAMGKYTLGDVSREKLEAVWYGKAFEEIRTKIKEGRRNLSQCEYCDWVHMF